jgi:hypothetical protein
LVRTTGKKIKGAVMANKKSSKKVVSVPNRNTSAFIKIENCVDCPFHKELPDPDPFDSFCSDDVKIVCTKEGGKPITVACRPHYTRKESKIPPWCPLLEENR